MTYHTSTAYLPDLVSRITGRGSVRRPVPVTEQFRFVIRLAQACHAKGVDYDLTWKIADKRAIARIDACGNIPDAKRVSVPREKPAIDWKPRMFEAVYSLEVFGVQDKETKVISKRPGFVIAHSCGLSLVKAGESESGELSSTDYSDDPKKSWSVTHTASGLGFGFSVSFPRAVKMLLACTEHPIDWTLPLAELQANIGFKRAGMAITAEFGARANDRERARYELKRMAA